MGELSDGKRAVAAIRHLRPDVVLLERVLPGRSGLQVLRELRDYDSQARVLLTCVDWDPPTVEAALEAGATGVLPKHAAADRLVEALREVVDGRRFRPTGEEEPDRDR